MTKNYFGSYIGKDSMMGFTLSVYKSDGTSGHFVKYNGKFNMVTTGTHSADGDKLFTKIVQCLASDKINNDEAIIFWGEKLLYDNSGTRNADYPEYFISDEQIPNMVFGKFVDGIVPDEWTSELEEIYKKGIERVNRFAGCEKVAGVYMGKNTTGSFMVSVYTKDGESGHFIKKDGKFYLEYVGTFTLVNSNATTNMAQVASPDKRIEGESEFIRQQTMTHKEGGVFERGYTEHYLSKQDFWAKVIFNPPPSPDGTIPDIWQTPLEAAWTLGMTRPKINPPPSAEEKYGDAFLYVVAFRDSKSLDDYSDKADYYCFAGITTGGTAIPLSVLVSKKPADIETWTSAFTELKKQDGRNIINFVYEGFDSGAAIIALNKIYLNSKGFDKMYMVPSDTPFLDKAQNLSYKLKSECRRVMAGIPFGLIVDIESRAKELPAEIKTALASL